MYPNRQTDKQTPVITLPSGKGNNNKKKKKKEVQEKQPDRR